MITFWNLNHTFKWYEDLNWYYGVGFAVALFGALFHVHDSVCKDEKSSKFQEIVSKLFLFLSLSNLVDELFFNPFVVNWHEYLTALITLTAIIHVTNRTKKTRN